MGRRNIMFFTMRHSMKYPILLAFLQIYNVTIPLKEKYTHTILNTHKMGVLKMLKTF